VNFESANSEKWIGFDNAVKKSKYELFHIRTKKSKYALYPKLYCLLERKIHEIQ
jgi:hypothetical protein